MDQIISPCGLNCSECLVYKDNVTPELQETLTAGTPIPQNEISCEGCKDGNVCISLKLQGKECATLNCSKEKGVTYCFECNEFPCKHLMPIADGANIYPHNTKLYNLCTMQRIGVQEWCNISEDIKNKYFTTKFEIGKGTINQE